MTEAQHLAVSKLVTFVRLNDGKTVERPARPPFYFAYRASATGRVVLPEGYYWRVSPEYSRRQEFGAA